ncbi:hypothetical protein [Aquifex sp.]
MKNLILKLGETLIDAFVLLGFLLILITAFVVYKLFPDSMDGLFFATLVLIVGSGVLLFTSFSIYILMDIRKVLKDIDRRLKD